MSVNVKKISHLSFPKIDAESTYVLEDHRIAEAVAADEGKVLTVTDANGTLGWQAAGGGVDAATNSDIDLMFLSKGSVITLDNDTTKHYRVLKLTGTVATVLSLDPMSPNDSYWHLQPNNDRYQQFNDGSYGAKYESIGLTEIYLDKACAINSFTHKSAEFNNAVISENIKQSLYHKQTTKPSSYTFEFVSPDGTFYYTRLSDVTLYTDRAGAAIDFDDIVEYFDLEAGGTLTNDQLLDMFYLDPSSANNPAVASRSAIKVNYDSYYYYDVMSENKLQDCRLTSGSCARPVFKIDLSLIDWSL